MDYPNLRPIRLEDRLEVSLSNLANLNRSLSRKGSARFRIPKFRATNSVHRNNIMFTREVFKALRPDVPIPRFRIEKIDNPFNLNLMTLKLIPAQG